MIFLVWSLIPLVCSSSYSMAFLQYLSILLELSEGVKTLLKHQSKHTAIKCLEFVGST